MLISSHATKEQARKGAADARKRGYSAIFFKNPQTLNWEVRGKQRPKRRG